jgi:hypothetical protein
MSIQQTTTGRLLTTEQFATLLQLNPQRSASGCRKRAAISVPALSSSLTDACCGPLTHWSACFGPCPRNRNSARCLNEAPAPANSETSSRIAGSGRLHVAARASASGDCAGRGALLPCRCVSRHRKVRDPNGNPHPLSLHGYVGADSGDGKSPTMSILTREIREFDDEFERARSNFENRRLARDLLFASNVKTLTKEIAKLKARGKDTAHLEGQLERAMIFAEHRVYAPRFLCADASSASIISLLRHRFPFALLGEDEGDIVFNSGVLRTRA